VPPLWTVYYLATALKKEAVGCVTTKVGLRDPKDETMISVYSK
jgi:hypothetical protein